MKMQNIVPWPYRLRKGHSSNPAEGACIMDAINWLAHGRHGDRPQCVDPILRGFCIQGNDWMPDDIRQKFLLRAHLLAGSNDPETRSARLRILVLGAVRIFLPMALDAAGAGFCDEAKKLRDLPDDVSYEEMKQIAAKTRKRCTSRTVEAASWAARAASWAAKEAARTGRTSRAAAATAVCASIIGASTIVWDKYFEVLDVALAAGKTGEPWSACDIDIGVMKYKKAAKITESV